MNNFFRKALLWVFVLSMLLGLVACGDKPEGPADGTGAQNGTTAGSPATTDEPSIKDGLDPSLNFGGREVNFLSWIAPYNTDFYAEIDIGDPVSDAVYERNMTVEKRLGVSLYTKFIDGDNANQASFVNAVLAETNAGGKTSFDVIASYSMCAGTLASYGVFQDLNTVQHLDTKMPYWSESVIQGSTINDKLYFVTGDMANTFIYNLYYLVVNNSLLEDYGLDDPRDMVLAKTWTLEAMMKLTTDVYSDRDDMPGVSPGDTYGFVLYGHPYYDCWLASTDIPMAQRGEDGIYRLTSDFIGDRMGTFVDKLNSFIYDNSDVSIDYSYGYSTITTGCALIGTSQVDMMPKLKENNIDYCVVPFPMMDDLQTSYSTNLGFAYTNFSVPHNAEDSAISGAVLECMASEAYHTSSKVFFENVIKSRYSNDPKDAQMFDIIKDSVYIDPCRLFVSSFEWSNSPTALFRQALLERRNWNAKIEGSVGYINGILSKLSESIVQP